MQIFLDTSFLVDALEFHIDIISGFRSLVPKYSLVTISAVVDELSKIASRKRIASIASLWLKKNSISIISSVDSSSSASFSLASSTSSLASSSVSSAPSASSSASSHSAISYSHSASSPSPYADNFLLSVIKTGDALATMDSALRQRAKAKGIRVFTLKGRKMISEW